jgi:hypothetical protein
MTTTRFPVEAGHIMCFARACGDTNPLFDPTAPGRDRSTVPAPLTFVQAREQYRSDSALRPRNGAPWPPPRDGDGVRLHAEQHYEYRRAVRSGDLLTARELPRRSWMKQGGRGGTLTFTELRDDAGELVIIARALSVLTSQPVR